MMVFLSLIMSPTLRSKFAVCKQTTGSVQTFSTTAVGKSFVLVDMVVSTGIIRGYGWYMWMCLFWLLVFLCCRVDLEHIAVRAYNHVQAVFTFKNTHAGIV